MPFRMFRPFTISPVDEVMRDIKRHGLETASLNLRESVALARRLERGNREAGDALVASVSLMAISEAKRFLWSGIPLEDLFQAGMVGACMALEKYEWRRGVKFATFANWWMYSIVSRTAISDRNIIRVPVRDHNDLRKVNGFCGAHLKANGVMPDAEAIESGMGVDPKTADRFAKILAALHTQSFSFGKDNSEADWEPEAKPEEDAFSWEALERAGRINDVRTALSYLDERRRSILMMRANGKSAVECAAVFKVSRERIRQLEMKGLEDLAYHLNAPAPLMSLDKSLRETVFA